MMNNELTEREFLLSPKGLLMHSGCSREMIYEYDRRAVPVLRRMLRLKEHDRYIFGNSSVMVELELSDLGYSGAVAATVVNFENKTQKSAVFSSPLSFGRMELPPSPLRGDVIFRAGEASMDFSKSTDKRYIRAHIERFDDVRSLYVNIISEQPAGDSFFAVEGYSDAPECFRMCYKTMCMPVSGKVVYGADTFMLSGTDSFCCLDWERSVLPVGSESTWYMAQGLADGIPLAFSFASRSNSQTQDVNAVFYDGTLYNPGDVRVQASREGTADGAHTSRGIRLHSEGNRVDLVFTPIIDSSAQSKALGVNLMNSRRQFGVWNGSVRLGSGRPVSVSELPGFSEQRSYRW